MRAKIRFFASTLPLLTFASVAAFGLVELFTYPGILLHNLGVSYFTLSLLSMVVLAALKVYYFSRDELPLWSFNITASLSLLSFVLSIIAALILFSLDVYTYPNYTFSQFGINHLMTLELATFSLGMRIIAASKSELKKYWQTYMLIIFLTSCLYLYVFSSQFFITLGQGEPFHGTDDTVFEWLQVALLLVAAGASFVAVRMSTTKVAKLLSSIFIVGCMFLAGEEISWGQRLISSSIEELEIVTANNLQNETNIHNLQGVNELFAYLYIFAFIYAAGSFLVRKKVEIRSESWLEHKEILQLVCFKAQEVFYLLPTFLFNPYIDRPGLMGDKSFLEIYDRFGLIANYNDFLVFMGIWREAFEVLFYAALLLRMLSYISYLDSTKSDRFAFNVK